VFRTLWLATLIGGHGGSFDFKELAFNRVGREFYAALIRDGSLVGAPGAGEDIAR
jgi:hypothetical protein